jgi:hypothetical protein
MFGLDLFDVGKNTVLPKAMLDALSYSPVKTPTSSPPANLQDGPCAFGR